MRNIAIVVLALATLATVGLVVTARHAGVPSAPVLPQSYIPIEGNAPLQVPALLTSKGRTFAGSELRGHWSLIFFGFTDCPLVCPRTLSMLAAVARDPKSGVSFSHTRLFFVSVDPQRDTPLRLDAYLKHFDEHIVGLTGSPEQIRHFSAEVGAGYQKNGPTLDHSTSVFVVDPNGRLAGILLRPNVPARVVADLSKIQRASAALN